MDIDSHVNSLVQNIISEITSKVQSQVMATVQQQVSDIVSKLDYTSLLASQINQKIDERLNRLPIDSKTIENQLLSRIDNLATNLSARVQTAAVEKINESVATQVNRLDFSQLCQSAFGAAIQNQTFEYPLGSIPGSAIDTSNWILSGENIVGGIIQKFGSSGIDDQATTCQLTIMDNTTVVENNLLTKDLTVKGTVNVEGDLNITGTVPESSPFFVNVVRAAADTARAGMDQSVFNGYADTVFDRIKREGIDLSKITLSGQEIVSGGHLNNSITFSNLQRVGQLRDLQTIGESLLSETLYTTNKRVGINTIEPSHVLSVWDQEIEIGLGKKENNVGVIGLPRAHTLVISSNNKDNITLTPDGAVKVNQLNIGQISITAAYSPPAADMPLGSIVFNANPSLGGPLGWVSLGDARWANFGIID